MKKEFERLIDENIELKSRLSKMKDVISRDICLNIKVACDLKNNPTINERQKSFYEGKIDALEDFDRNLKYYFDFI